MAYDAELAARIRDLLSDRAGVTEKQMFGGIAFLLHGNMCVGVINDDLVARLSKDEGEDALDEPHVRPMDFTGRPMRGWLYVAPPGTKTKRALRKWIDRCHAFADSLPPKTAKKTAKKKKAKKKAKKKKR